MILRSCQLLSVGWFRNWKVSGRKWSWHFLGGTEENLRIAARPGVALLLATFVVLCSGTSQLVQPFGLTSLEKKPEPFMFVACVGLSKRSQTHPLC